MHGPRVLPLAVLFAVAAFSLPAAAADLALKRAMLSTGGVGYFEFEAEIDGAATLTLPVRRDQVDDILKSLVVYDDKGAVGTIALAGDQPLQDALRGLPFDEHALSAPDELLNTLRGAEVAIGGSKEISGRVLSAVPELKPFGMADGPMRGVTRLTIMTAQGLRSVVLEDAETVKFADPKLQAAVERALAAEAASHDQSGRVISIAMTGQGRRMVRAAYLTEAPLWKASYRLTLDRDQAAKTAALQGWAVLENRSGADWNGVEVSLVSGDPVTFRQALYRTYYVQRPQVPVEVLGRILPATDTGAIPGASGGVRAELKRAQVGQGVSAGAMAASPVPMPLQDKDAFARNAAEVSAAESSEAATQVDFRLPQPVTLKSGDDLLVPLAVRNVPAERLSWYQAAVGGANPLAAVALTNDGASGLPPGVATIYEKDAATGRVDYLGDARLSPWPTGERRILSFAVDVKTKIEHTSTPETHVIRAHIADGIMQVTTARQARYVYTVVAPPKEARRVLIEVPRLGGDWTLVDPDPAKVERTDRAWRIARDVAAGETQTFAVVTQYPVEERISLSTLDPERIGYYAAQTSLTAEQRKALTRLGELATAFAAQGRKLAQLDAQKTELATEQARVRDNLGAVPKGSDVERRYLKMLTDQEDKIAKLADERIRAVAAQDQARQALADYVKSLSL